MRFRSHQCWFPKDVDFPRDYEDASARSEKHGRAVVADGVSSAIFSRNWARLLTHTAVELPPALDSDEAIRGWIEPLQRAWRQDIDFNSLKWHQKPKATSVGAQATLLIVDVEPLADATAVPGEYRLRASALGDCVLYLVREGRKLLSFPLTQSAEFAQPPEIFSSIAKGVAYAEKFRHLDERCQAGDLVVVCSDAVGLWAMEEYEAGRTVDWMRYWENDRAWQEDIQRLRDNRPSDGNRMRVDDCTLLLLQIVVEESVEGESEVQPDRSDEPFVLIGTEAATDVIPAAKSPMTADAPVTEAAVTPVMASADEVDQADLPPASDAVAADSFGNDGHSIPGEVTTTDTLLVKPGSALPADGVVASPMPDEHSPLRDTEEPSDRRSARGEDHPQSTGLFSRLRRMLAGPSSPCHDRE